MKRLFYILMLLLSLSCKDNALKSTMEASDIEINEESTTYEMVRSPLKSNYEDFASEKLKEYIDLLKLKAEHPEFQQDIQQRLNNFTSDELMMKTYSQDMEIENIRQSEMIRTSDSTQTMVLHYDLIDGDTTMKDSILAIVTSKIIVLDNREVISNKIRFQNIN